jgi:hypothetical protein
METIILQISQNIIKMNKMNQKTIKSKNNKNIFHIIIGNHTMNGEYKYKL